MSRELTYDEAVKSIMSGNIIQDEGSLLIRVVHNKIEVLTRTQNVLYARRLNNKTKYYTYDGEVDEQ